MFRFRLLAVSVLLLLLSNVISAPLSADTKPASGDFVQELSALRDKGELFRDERFENEYLDRVSRKALEEARKELNIPKDEDALALIDKNGGKEYRFKLAGGEPVIYTFDADLLNQGAISQAALEAVKDGRACMRFQWLTVVFRPDGEGGLEVQVEWPRDGKTIISRAL